ncbi:MAG: SpoIIE family protein phosphatase [Microscillaceae bacterium]|nr:SpoIIE family protein phosphatase [Microscillaceae bacterium]
MPKQTKNSTPSKKFLNKKKRVFDTEDKKILSFMVLQILVNGGFYILLRVLSQDTAALWCLSVMACVFFAGIVFFLTRSFQAFFRNMHLVFYGVLFMVLSFFSEVYFSPFVYWLLTIPMSAFLLGNRTEMIIWSAFTVFAFGSLGLKHYFLEDHFAVWVSSDIVLERYSLLSLIGYALVVLVLREWLDYQKYTNLQKQLIGSQRENQSLKRQFHVLDNRNFRLVKLYQNLKKFETNSEQRTEIITEAALALSSKNKEIQNVVDRFMTQSKKLEEINEDLTNSIRYAQRIQAAITPDSELVISKFRDAFIYYQPRDIVSGDFYWFAEKKYLDGQMKILIVADCTGHGVPGAFMTIMGNSLINEIVNEMKVLQPDWLLQELDRKLIETLSSRNGQAIHDGMDMVVLMIDDRQKLIHYAAAHNPMYYVRKEKIHELKGSKFAVGSSQYKTRKEFKLHTVQAEPGDVFYIFTDGFQDQFGEKEKRKYMTRRFRNFLCTINRMPLKMQGEKVKSEFEHWKGNIPQTDDVLVIGFRM